MGNQSSAQRSHATITNQMEGKAFVIDKHRQNKNLSTQSSEDEPAPDIAKIAKHPESLGEPHLSRHRLNVDCDPNKKMLPVVIKWSGAGNNVQLAGEFSNWKTIPMVKSEKDFTVIVDLPEGDHEYKFLVDGEWKVNDNDDHTANTMGTENNVITVKESDFQELENALLHDPNDSKGGQYHVSNMPLNKAEVNSESDSYGQVTPTHSAADTRRGPPVLPPHLLQVILNKDTPVSCEPTLLPEPNHVMLNHMYALSIRDGTMVLSTSHRYKKKCVTTLIYRPI